MPIDLSALTGGGNGYKNKVMVTSSGNWTVPAGVYEILVWATGGGGGGVSSNSSNTAGVKGGAASGTIAGKINVFPGDLLGLVVGVGGQSNQQGGNTTVSRNGIPIFFAYGGNSVAVNPSASPIGSSIGYSFVCSGGGGGNGAAQGSFGAQSGFLPFMGSVQGNVSSFMIDFDVSTGGTAGTQRGPGGGGGSSIYGKGGNGANGSNSTGGGLAGGHAPSTSYGAGGGGASGTTNTAVGAGGKGANGVVEIWY